MSELVFGTAGLAKNYGIMPLNLEPDAARKLVLDSFQAGIRIFDTAPAYGDAESLLGDALGGQGAVWTKINSYSKDDLELSFSRLRRDKIDLLQWHNWEESLLDNPKFHSFWKKIKQNERILRLGATTYGVTNAGAAIESGLFDVVQIEWNLLNQIVMDAVAPIAKRNRVKIAVRSIYLQGVLSDDGRSLPKLPILQAGVRRAKELAAKHHLSLSEFVLRSALGKSEIDYVVIGFGSIEQVWMALHSRSEYCDDIKELCLNGHPETDPRNDGYLSHRNPGS